MAGFMTVGIAVSTSGAASALPPTTFEASTATRCKQIGVVEVRNGVTYMCNQEKNGVFWKRLTAKEARRLTQPSRSKSTFVVPAPQSPMPSARFEFGPDMSSESRALVVDWVTVAGYAQLQMLGRTISDFEVEVSGDLAWVSAQECEKLGVVTGCEANTLRLFSTGGAWAGCTGTTAHRCSVTVNWQKYAPTSPASRVFAFKTFAHEMHHVFQYQTHRQDDGGTPLNQVRPTGPVWLIEGAAEVVAHHVLDQVGEQSLATTRKTWAASTRKITKPLSQLETYLDLVGLVNPYDMYGLAVDSLVSRSGRGPQSLVEYYRLLGEGVTWQSAFEQSFGQAVGDFYAYFESVRPR